MRVGIISDLHLPWSHPCFMGFCTDVFQQWRVNHIVFIGDVVDAHAISQWSHSPDGMSAGDEYEKALAYVADWRRQFPKAVVTIGNHCSRHLRLAHKSGMPAAYLRSYADLWETPKWDWCLEKKIDGITYLHGSGTSGKNAALNLAIQRRTSIVQGHVHSWAGVAYHANADDIIFGMNVGCGVDVSAYSFEYQRDFPVRPILGCAVVIDGEHPVFVRMPCGVKERYHRDRAKRRRAA